MRTCQHTGVSTDRSALQVLRDVLAALFPDLEQQLAPLKDTLDLFARADTVCALLHELPFPVPDLRHRAAVACRSSRGPYARVPSAV
jgi:hypothetical protein